jgi:hypothetical protein
MELLGHANEAGLDDFQGDLLVPVDFIHASNLRPLDECFYDQSDVQQDVVDG